MSADDIEEPKEDAAASAQELAFGAARATLQFGGAVGLGGCGAVGGQIFTSAPEGLANGIALAGCIFVGLAIAAYCYCKCRALGALSKLVAEVAAKMAAAPFPGTQADIYQAIHAAEIHIHREFRQAGFIPGALLLLLATALVILGVMTPGDLAAGREFFFGSCVFVVMSFATVGSGALVSSYVMSQKLDEQNCYSDDIADVTTIVVAIGDEALGEDLVFLAAAASSAASGRSRSGPTPLDAASPGAPPEPLAGMDPALPAGTAQLPPWVEHAMRCAASTTTGTALRRPGSAASAPAPASAAALETPGSAGSASTAALRRARSAASASAPRPAGLLVLGAPGSKEAALSGSGLASEGPTDARLAPASAPTRPAEEGAPAQSAPAQAAEGAAESAPRAPQAPEGAPARAQAAGGAEAARPRARPKSGPVPPAHRAQRPVPRSPATKAAAPASGPPRKRSAAKRAPRGPRSEPAGAVGSFWSIAGAAKASTKAAEASKVRRRARE